MAIFAAALAIAPLLTQRNRCQIIRLPVAGAAAEQAVPRRAVVAMALMGAAHREAALRGDVEQLGAVLAKMVP